MLRTVQFPCSLPKSEADALNAESGRIYTDMLVSHYWLYRKQGVWLTHENGERSRRSARGYDHAACPQPRCGRARLLQSLQDRASLSEAGHPGQIPLQAQALEDH